MTKGRGSNERRRNSRQKRANWMDKHASLDMMERFQERRKSRMFKDRKPKVYKPHPLEKKK